jgi:hypothetical protein
MPRQWPFSTKTPQPSTSPNSAPSLGKPLLAAIKAKVGLTPKTAEREIMLRFGPYHDGVARLQAELERLGKLENVSFDLVAHKSALKKLLADK